MRINALLRADRRVSSGVWPAAGGLSGAVIGGPCFWLLSGAERNCGSWRVRYSSNIRIILRILSTKFAYGLIYFQPAESSAATAVAWALWKGSVFRQEELACAVGVCGPKASIETAGSGAGVGRSARVPRPYPLLPDCIREATREALKRACDAAVAADEEEWMSTEVTTTDSIRTRRPTDSTDAVQHRMENGGPARCNRCRSAFEESLAWMAANGGNVEPV